MRKILNDEQSDYLKSILPNRLNKDLADIINDKYGLNLSAQQIKTWKRARKLKSTPDGGRHLTRKPIGSEIIGKHGYVMIKVLDGKTDNYVMKQRYVWEQHYGKIPDTHVIKFLDGNRLNCNVDNLLLVDRGELARGNMGSSWTKNKEINESVYNLEKLKTKLNEVLK